VCVYATAIYTYHIHYHIHNHTHNHIHTFIDDKSRSVIVDCDSAFATVLITSFFTFCECVYLRVCVCARARVCVCACVFAYTESVTLFRHALPLSNVNKCVLSLPIASRDFAHLTFHLSLSLSLTHTHTHTSLPPISRTSRGEALEQIF